MKWHNVTVKLKDLAPWGENPKGITKKRAKALLEYWDEIGQFQTIAIGPKNGNGLHPLYDGHQRLNVLKAAYGPDLDIDARESSRALDDDERAKMTLMSIVGTTGFIDWDIVTAWDNPATQEWGLDADTLKQWNVDAGALGAMLDSVEEDNAGKDTEPQLDKAEELRQQWGVELGQMWQLGEHRIICGDCTDKAVVDRVMGGDKAALTFTSPPYNAGVSAQLSGNTGIGNNLYKDGYDDNKTQDEWLHLVTAATEICLSVSQFVFVNIQILAGNKIAFVKYWFNMLGYFADVAIWDKQHAAPQQAQRVMDSRFEFILIFSHNPNRAIGTREFRGMVHNVYSGKPQRKNEFADSHAATFPVDFPEHFINTFSNSDEVILEPFNGTGTTLIACENLNRQCRAVEIDPGYVAITLQRWADHTGKTPVLIE